MHKSVRDILDSAEFRHLVVTRWRVSLVLTALLFVLYYGYIMLIAINRQLLSRRDRRRRRRSASPLGAAVIVGAWVLTAIYVVWANRRYDPEVAPAARQVRTDAASMQTTLGTPDACRPSSSSS